jgi:hypothetical protein
LTRSVGQPSVDEVAMPFAASRVVKPVTSAGSPCATTTGLHCANAGTDPTSATIVTMQTVEALTAFEAITLAVHPHE